jgi:hypothetical protein
MHYPKCGTRMTNRAGVIWCVPGEMELSSAMARYMTDIVEMEPQPAANFPRRTINLGDEWFCPADGTRLQTADDAFPTCPACKRIVPGGVIHQVVELHLHRRWPAGWDHDRSGHSFRTDA